MSPEARRHLLPSLLVLTLGRMAINIGLRMTYPFLPAFSRGLGVSFSALARLISLRSFAGMLSPLFSPLSARFGRRPIITAAAALFGLAALIVVIWPAYWSLGLTLALISVAKVIYDPPLQAYVGDAVPYGQRGKALAFTEFSWAGALLLGAPAVGWLIARQGWRAPFFWLGVAGLGTALLLLLVMPAGKPGTTGALSLRALGRVVRQKPVIWAAAAYVLLLMVANDVLFIVYGNWMEASFGLSLTSLGLVSGVIGGAEILGELSAGWAVDRFGKRPVIISSGLLSALAYALLPLGGHRLALALLALFLTFYLFELTVVGGVPLLTEIVPQERNVVMSVVMAAGALGRAVGAWLSPLVWNRGGLWANGLLSAGISLLAILVLARWVREHRPHPAGTP